MVRKGTSSVRTRAVAVAMAAMAWACAVHPALGGGPDRVLVFTRTAGFRHDAIPAGVAMMQRLGAANCFEVEHTEDPAAFTPANLARFETVVFLCTTGDVLGPAEQAAFEAFITGGGGFVGVHSAADTEYTWPFYGDLLAGAYFSSHPAIQQASIVVEDPGHPSTAHLADPWVRTDEWYNFQQNPRPLARILLALDEGTYAGGTMGADHPIAWCRDLGLGLGRSWYTAGGHTIASYTEPAFERHVLGGVLWASGWQGPDCNANGSPDACDIALGRSLDADGDGRPDECGPPCIADFNRQGGVTVQDVFDFLAAYVRCGGAGRVP